MKKDLLNVITEYLKIFPEEKQRQEKLVEFLNKHEDKEIMDWNNFNGHLVAGGFVYSKKENKFLVLWHRDLAMYLYPGGHIDQSDINTLEASKREIKEETNLNSLINLNITNNPLIPIDIDTHIISYNERLNLPEHYHFEFRYLFLIEKEEDIKIDTKELSNYKWIDINELKNDPNYGKIVNKIKKVIK